MKNLNLMIIFLLKFKNLDNNVYLDNKFFSILITIDNPVLINFDLAVGPVAR